MDIGNKIKHLRKECGLTLEELASRAGLSKGFLSQLERNLSSPNIAALGSLLEALGTSLGEFFKEERDERVVFSEKEHRLDVKPTHSIRWIVPNAQKRSMEPILVDLPPEGRSFELSPVHGEEFGYVLEGKIELYIDDRKYILKKGETFYMHSNAFHRIENPRKQPARVLWVSTPPIF